MSEALSTLPLRAQVEHLQFMLEELTALPPEWVNLMDDAGVRLGRAEARVLGALQHRPGAVLTYDALLAAVTWDRPDAEPRRQIINVYVSRLRSKLKEAGLPGRIEVVYHAGFRWVPE